MDDIAKKFSAAYEYMDGLSVYEVRNIAREMGIRSPTTEKKGYVIIFKCQKCGVIRKNTAAKDDNMDLIIKLSCNQ